MKKIVFLLLTVSFLCAYGQEKGSIETRALRANMGGAKGAAAIPERLVERYPLRHVGGRDYIGVLAKVDGAFEASELERKGVKVTSRVGDIVSMRVPLERLWELENCEGVMYYSVAHRVAPDVERTRLDTRTDSVQRGLGVPMPFDGEGVLIGITDWGFDYTHPNINKKSNPRIVRAWDHFKLSGPAPEGFDYGTEYRTNDELRAAGGDTSGLYGYGTHGTHVAGICGGNGNVRGEGIGQAPAAKFILGSWYLDEASWLDQVAWMKGVAEQEGKRLVINSSWGMYTFSTLDGTSLLSQAINAYSDSGIVFVTSAGNNGDAKYHLQHRFGEEDTLRSIASYMGTGIGQGLICWGEPRGSSAVVDFEVGFAMVSMGNSAVRYSSPLFSTENDVPYYESYVVAGSDTIRYDVMIERSNPLDGRPHVVLNVDRSYGYNIMLVCTADSGSTVNIWNVGNVRNNAGNTGNDFVHNNIEGCTPGDHFYGIGEPACAEKTISVAAHVADHYDSDSVYTTGALTYFSSHGPTLDGRNKPEISAPGSNVISSISSRITADDMATYTAEYEAVSGGKRYIWSRMSGTSMSSPAVTGVVALMLQANPTLTVDDIREIIFSTARNDDKTGALRANDSVSIQWGYGKIDALRAVNAAYDKLGIEESAKVSPSLVVFPNPTSGMVTLRTGSNRPQLARLYSIDGKVMREFTVTSETTMDLSGLSSGVYFVQVGDNRSTRTAKVVVR